MSTLTPTNCSASAPIDPLVPSDVDLHNYPWIKLRLTEFVEHPAFLSSKRNVLTATIRLWERSMRLKPASSLPDDDRVLTLWAGLGSDKNSWKKIKDAVLIDCGWILATDNRWYHPMFAAIALETWEAKQKYERQSKLQSDRSRGKSSKSAPENASDSQDGTEVLATAGQPRIIRGSDKREDEKKMTTDDRSEHKESEQTTELETKGERITFRNSLTDLEQNSRFVVSSNSSESSLDVLASEGGTTFEVNGKRFTVPVWIESKSIEERTKYVFEFWRNITGRSLDALTKKRKSLIVAWLSLGASVCDLCSAVVGALKSDYHMGRKAGYPGRRDTLEVIFDPDSDVKALQDLCHQADHRNSPEIAAAKTADAVQAVLTTLYASAYAHNQLQRQQ